MIDKALNETVKEIRQENLARARLGTKASSWMETDRLDGEVVNAGVVILPTRGCSWGRSSGCTMCGYVYEAGSLNDEGLANTFREAVSKLKDISYLKIFTSGSFFDTGEVSEGLLQSIMEAVNEKGVRQLQVESRPEFIKKDRLQSAKGLLKSNLEVGIGLETSSDLIREHSINKGFTFEDYEKSVRLCKSMNVLVKTYLLLKPPFILEREAISDVVKSGIDAAKAGSEKISINPMNIQRGTLVELLWKRGEYRTPWLWSLVETLKQISKSNLDIPVFSHPSGAGTRRGVHNCGRCDQSVIKAVKEFSLTQDIDVLDALDCACKRHWSDHLFLE